MADGDIVVTGTLDENLLVTRMSPEGDVRWSSTYGPDGQGSSSIVIAGAIACAPSGMLVFRGQDLFRLNDSGTVRWAHRYQIHTESSGWVRVTMFSGAAELPDSGYAVCGTFGGGLFLCRLSRDGTIVWTNTYPLHGYFNANARVFGLPGGGLLLGATSLTPVDGRQTVGLLWLSAEGKVQRSLAYAVTAKPTSRFVDGQMINMILTSTGPVLCQCLYSDGCYGTNVIKLDMAGTVQWTTWVGGLRRGAADARLWGIDVNPDGSLVLGGATSEFSEYQAWGYDGLTMKLTAGGDVAWMSTVDRGTFFTLGKDSPGGTSPLWGEMLGMAFRYAEDRPLAVVATGDGGLAWAATSVRTNTDLFVTRMGHDGTAGKLGVYLTQVDIGNARLVRIEHPTVTSAAYIRTSEAITCESEDIQVSPTDAGLTGTDVEGTALATLTLQPLYPADPGTASTIMQGGTMYRYYTVLDANGATVAGAELRYHGPFSSTTLTATSDEHGEIVFSFFVPRTAKTQHWGSTLTIDRVRVGGLRSVLSSRPDFATDVQPLSWSTNWMMGNGLAGKAGLGVGAGVFGAAQQAGGMVVTRTQADPAKGDAGSLTVADSMSNEAAIGVSGELASVRLGPVEAKAGDASAKDSVGTFTDFATLFKQPSECSATDKLMAALALLCGVEQTMSDGATTLISLAQQAIVAALSSDVEMDHVTGGVSLGFSADASALALELSKEEEKKAGEKEAKKSSLSGVSIGKLGESAKATVCITGYPGAGEVSGKAGLEFEVSFSVLEALGYSVLGWSGSDAVSAEVFVDPLNASFERFVVTMSVPPDDRGESQETRLTVDRSVLGVAAEAAIAQLMALAPAGTTSSDERIVINKEFCGEILHGVVNAVSSIAIPYEHVVTQDKNPTSIEVGLGVNILGNQVDLAIKPTWGRYQAYPLERGLFVPVDKQLHVGRMVKLESYPASLFTTQVDTLPSVVVELLKGVGELLSKVWDIASGLLSSAADTVLSVGAGLGKGPVGGATTVIGKGTNIVLSSLSYGPDPSAVFVSSSSTRQVRLVGAPAGQDAFAIGGTYALEPENGVLSKPATLTLRYGLESLGKRDPASLGIYRYDQLQRSWTPVPATHDKAGRKFTAQITRLGGYCIGCDVTPPAFELLLPSGTPPVVTTSLPHLTVASRDQGAGVVQSAFTASIDDHPVQAVWSASAQQGTLTVVDPLADGSHMLTVKAVDGAGNQGSATFNVEVRQAPAPPVLRVDDVSAGRVQLGLEAGAGGGQPTSFALWRAEPAVGVVYHRVATVKAGAGAYVDKNVQPGTTYLYAAIGLTSTQTEGPMSEPLRVTLPSSPGTGDQTGTEQSRGVVPLWLLTLFLVALLAAGALTVAWVTKRRRRPPAA
jgi:hypothetical protein